MVEPRRLVLGCFDGRVHPCISLWISGGSSFTTAGSISSTLNIHALLPEGSAPLLVLLLSAPCAGTLNSSALFASEELPGPNMISIQRQRDVSAVRLVFASLHPYTSSPPHLDDCKSVHWIFFSHGGQIDPVKETSISRKFPIRKINLGWVTGKLRISLKLLYCQYKSEWFKNYEVND